MKVKKIVTFFLEDVQVAISLIAKKEGVSFRFLTQTELKTIVEDGAVNLELDSLEVLPIVRAANIVPTQFFVDVAVRVHALTVFVKNISEDVLYEHLIPVMESVDVGSVFTEYYQHKKTTYSPQLKQVYGDDWRVKSNHLGRMYVSVGGRLLEVLRNELRNSPIGIKGVKGFTSTSSIDSIETLGLSVRTSNTLDLMMKRLNIEYPFTLGDFITTEHAKKFPRIRNLGEKTMAEIEDFILLYGL